MAQSAERAREGGATRSSLLPAILAALVLVPLGFIAGQAWTGVDARRSTVDNERHGLEYLRALGGVASALADAQTGAVTGRPATRDTLTRAIDTAAAVDRRLGGELRTTERWAALRGSIEALPANGRDPLTTAAAYPEPTSLLIALYRVVEINSTLIRDTEPDVYFLADTAAQQLPQVIAAIGRLGDVALLTAARPSTEQGSAATAAATAGAAADLAVARAAVAGPTADLADDLQAAVDGTQSQTLSANLLSRLDRFRRGVDALLPIATPAKGTPDPAKLVAARVEAQQAAADLATNVLREIDSLLGVRADDLSGSSRLVVGLTAVAVLLAAGPALLAVRARRRSTTGASPPAAGPSAPSPAGPSNDLVLARLGPADDRP